jgi:hypothetical protein
MKSLDKIKMYNLDLYLSSFVIGLEFEAHWDGFAYGASSLPSAEHIFQCRVTPVSCKR